ncbi:hypothetical protein R5R35_000587 [Gryllus longicercus]|uniref:DUF4773 domain-containing protein n=1 Tax=Gryllus longicercus TaxID=2509291 RepID=A0AAN9Z4Y3_9ORTH
MTACAAPPPPPPLVLLLLLVALMGTLPLAAYAASAADGDTPRRDADLKNAGGLQKHGARPEGEKVDPGIQFFRPGPAHKLWPFDGRMPCTCEGFGCGCCAQMVVSSFNFNRTGCMNLTYEPYEFAVVARLFFGETMLYERSFSGKNPPPACVPVPVPYVPSVDFCVQFFDIYTPGRNLHLCMDWLARLQRAPVVVLHFDCMRMGSDGIALLKPEDGDGLPPSTPAPSPAPPAPPPDAPPDDIYDEVAPGRNNTLRDADAVDPQDEDEGEGEGEGGAASNSTAPSPLTEHLTESAPDTLAPEGSVTNTPLEPHNYTNQEVEEISSDSSETR